MTSATTTAAHRPALGILFMCLASTVFPVMNGLVQVLSPRYSSEQLVWVRTASHLLIVLALLLPAHGMSIVKSARPQWQIARSLLLMCSTLCFFNGVKYLPLASAASISFTAPFIVTLLAWPILGETFGIRRFAAVLVGFLGVLVVIRPGSSVFHWASFLILGSAFFYALYQICTRKVAGHDKAETSVVYSALAGTVLLVPVAYLVWTPVTTWLDTVTMISLGLFGALGHFFVAKAMSYAAANVVAPFHYWQIVGSVIVGYLVSGKLPDAYTWVGAAIIISAGIYLVVRETRVKRGIAAKVE
jgi:drug/metabolite transporter (DMT)-like permease